MHEPQPSLPGPSAGPSAGPPRPAGGERRRLDRAPGERYGKGADGTGGGGAGSTDRSAIIRAILVAVAGALAFFLLGLVDLGAGLIVVAAFIGWVVALALVWNGRGAVPQAGPRMAVAALLGGWSIGAAILADWVYALVQGGVLGPLDYVAQRYGIVALLCVAAAAGVSALRVR